MFSLQVQDHVVSVVSSWLPPLITFLGWLRFRGIDDVIDKINGHLIETEKAHSPLNWTTYYRTHNKWKVLKKTRQFLWLVLGAATVAGAIYITWWKQ